MYFKSGKGILDVFPDRDILVYRSYFHFCFIPVFPIGAKQIEMRCRNCGDETKLENVVKEYEDRAKTPFYLYSALIIFVCITGLWFYWNSNTKKRKTQYVEKPEMGDIYTVTKEESGGTAYYFLKLVEINRDSVKALRNNHFAYRSNRRLVYRSCEFIIVNIHFVHYPKEFIFGMNEMEDNSGGAYIVADGLWTKQVFDQR